MIIETIVTTMDAAGTVNIAPMGVDWTGGDDAPVLKPFLETVTYRISKEYFSGIDEWQLIMQASAPTSREAAGAARRRSPMRSGNAPSATACVATARDSL